MTLSPSAWRRLRFSQTFPVLLGTLALLLLAKAPGKLASSAPDAAPRQESMEAADAPAGQPPGGDGNEAPPGGATGPARAAFTGEPASRGGAPVVRAEKGGGGAAIVTDHRDPVLGLSRRAPDSLENDHAPSRPASPFAPRAPPSPRTSSI